MDKDVQLFQGCSELRAFKREGIRLEEPKHELRISSIFLSRDTLNPGLLLGLCLLYVRSFCRLGFFFWWTLFFGTGAGTHSAIYRRQKLTRDLINKICSFNRIQC